MQPDENAVLRRIFRFYSHQYYTPLHVVQKLPLEDILVAYFEHQYEELEEPLLQEELYSLTDTDEERAQKQQQLTEDDRWVEAVKEEAQRQKAPPKAPVPPPPPDIVKVFDGNLDEWANSDPLSAPTKKT